MKRTILLVAITAALLGTATATAATIGDLQAAGYTVSVSSQIPGATPGALCNVYYISGHGVGEYANECDPGFQAQIDSLANPVAICNADWQAKHPDQLQALQAITGKGWAVSGDQCADVYNVTNPSDGTVAYSGSGAGLPGFNDSHASPPAGQAAPGTQPPAPSSCLPLCPSPGDTRGAGGVLIPAQLQAAAVAAVTPQGASSDSPPVAAASYTVVPATPEEVAANPDVLGWLNTPYMTTPLLAPAEGVAP